MFRAGGWRGGEREGGRERGQATLSTGLVVFCAPATTVLGPSLSPSLNPDPWNAADLSCCLFLSSSSRSTAPCLKQQGQDGQMNKGNSYITFLSTRIHKWCIHMSRQTYYAYFYQILTLRQLQNVHMTTLYQSLLKCWCQCMFSPGFCNRGVHFGMHRVFTSPVKQHFSV